MERAVQILLVSGSLRAGSTNTALLRTALERAAGSEDAFDATVSALRMAEHVQELEGLEQSRDEVELLEGAVWVPPTVAAGGR